MQVYYAHAMCTYGTVTEKLELQQIRCAFRGARIINPAKYDSHPEKLADTVGFCFRLVEKSNAVVFSRLMGKVTSGVGKEVNHALRLGRPVYELQSGLPRLIKSPVKYLSRAGTRVLYKRWRLSL